MSAAVRNTTVGQFLDDVAARTPAPGGGGVAAVAVGAAAALVAMAARFAEGELTKLADRADRIRAEVIPLVEADAEAYGAVLDAYRLPRQQPDRLEQIATALRAAADVPLRIAQAGSEVATLASRLATQGNRNLVGDAHTAVLLAEGATRAAAGLVRINAEAGKLDDAWLEHAGTYLSAARDAAASLPAH
ncbi:MAG: cyclodeaminase/cyclohydrolase family protein [Haloechinothrix sp.]